MIRSIRVLELGTIGMTTLTFGASEHRSRSIPRQASSTQRQASPKSPPGKDRLLRRSGTRALTRVGSRNPMGRLSLDKIPDPEKLENELQSKGLKTFQLGKSLHVFHEKAMERVKKFLGSNKETQDILNNWAETPDRFDHQSKHFERLFKSKATLLADLQSVGPKKPVGYLPLSTIEIFASPDEVQKQLEEKGLSTILRRPSVARVGSGALYAFDPSAVQKILDKPKNNAELKKENWPTQAEPFVRYLSSGNFAKKGPLFDIVADAFSDFGNPGRIKKYSGRGFLDR